ncbi:DgyrCDS13288 [Dimorphilus gyrociliatus]|uniref:DgyrCDS13288 n=1 Tax=Dimorphilus gyrociliatus TaxID=2664684 RepID=A0A7I8WAB0_9ANNE|nr:DgyrCDS13288 [Dimorphilus gyrociliatus]
MYLKDRTIRSKKTDCLRNSFNRLRSFIRSCFYTESDDFYYKRKANINRRDEKFNLLLRRKNKEFTYKNMGVKENDDQTEHGIYDEDNDDDDDDVGDDGDTDIDDDNNKIDENIDKNEYILKEDKGNWKERERGRDGNNYEMDVKEGASNSIQREIENVDSMSGSQVTVSEKSLKLQPTKPDYVPNTVWKDEGEKNLLESLKEKDLKGKERLDSTEFYYLRLRKMFLKNYENIDHLLTDGKDLDIMKLLSRIIIRTANKLKEAGKKGHKKDMESVQSILDRHFENKKTKLPAISFENLYDRYLTNYGKKQYIKRPNASTQTVKVSSRLLGINDGIDRPKNSTEAEVERKVQSAMDEIESDIFTETNMKHRRKRKKIY